MRTEETERQGAEGNKFFITEGTLAALPAVLLLKHYFFFGYCATFQKHGLTFFSMIHVCSSLHLYQI